MKANPFTKSVGCCHGHKRISFIASSSHDYNLLSLWNIQTIGMNGKHPETPLPNNMSMCVFVLGLVGGHPHSLFGVMGGQLVICLGWLKDTPFLFALVCLECTPHVCLMCLEHSLHMALRA